MGKHLFFNDMKKLPNLLCIYRFVAIFTGVLLFLFGFPISSALLGLTAGLTDYLDGYVARRFKMVTRLGALLDTVADLLFNFVVISLAIYVHIWPFWLLLAWGLRDLTVLAMRTSAAQLGFDIPSSMLGKVASNFIYYALFLMPFAYALQAPDYAHAAWVAEHIDPYFISGLHYLALGACILGVLMQWLSAAGYARRYIEGYDRAHRRNETGGAEAGAALGEAP